MEALRSKRRFTRPRPLQIEARVVGIGHADLLVVDGVTIMYTQTGEQTRGRYVLAWKQE